MNLIHSILLPLVLTNGNTGQTKNWFVPAKCRKKIENLIRITGNARDPEEGPFEFPVVLRITRILGKGQHLWDSDSVGRGNAKQLIDSLVACRWLVDDNLKYIAKTEFCQEKPKKRNERSTTLIEFFSV